MPCRGVPAIFSVQEASEVKFPALEGFVLPTDIHVRRGTRLVGRGVVIKTGDETVMGSIAGLVASLDSGKTPINKEVE